MLADKLLKGGKGFREGREQIAEGDRQVAEGEREIDVGESRLDAGERELSRGRDQLTLAGGDVAVKEANERLRREHWAVRFIVRVEYYRSRLVTALLKFVPSIKSSTIRKRRREERSKRQDIED